MMNDLEKGYQIGSLDKAPTYEDRMNHNYQDIEQIVTYLNKKSDGVANVYAQAALMLESLAKDRARLKQRVVDLEEHVAILKQWEKRYLDVIETMARDSNEALKQSLRTVDGKLE